MDLNLHQYKDQLLVKKSEGQTLLFDPIRQQYVVLQPEEIVRQLLVCFLIDSGYPKSLIQVEKGISINGLQRRFDILVYDKLMQPYMAIECKSHTVKISQDTFDQICGYNHVLKAPYLVVSNGVNTYCGEYSISGSSLTFLDTFPKFPG